MIKASVDGIVVEKRENGKNYVCVSLVSDTKDEVLANGTNTANIKNLGKDDVITFGSTCLCTDGSFGILDSSLTWKF